MRAQACEYKCTISCVSVNTIRTIYAPHMVHFSNLETAINDNFPGATACDDCNAYPKFVRTFGEHIFIEVIRITHK